MGAYYDVCREAEKVAAAPPETDRFLKKDVHEIVADMQSFVDRWDGNEDAADDHAADAPNGVAGQHRNGVAQRANRQLSLREAVDVL